MFVAFVECSLKFNIIDCVFKKLLQALQAYYGFEVHFHQIEIHVLRSSVFLIVKLIK